ncbi:MAG: membrane dipeptidase [Rhizobiales bacterium]|nr:membrane dipeptidase [Hyphomicrobiales bacterium]MBI3673727.1 membrane dipeptidase [Hyphomicrobiales bacterium]
MSPVFDGHNDLLLRLWLKRSETAVQDFVAGDGKGHMDLPRMRSGGFAGGLFAIFAPNADDPPLDDDNPNPPAPLELPASPALTATIAMASLLVRMARAAPKDFRICRSAAEIRAAIASGAIAAVMHMEGAEAIDPGLKALDVLHESGLRSLGPVWSRPNAFGHGVPFRFPSSPDTGPGLTATGKALIRRCNELRIAIDLSHLNEKGFWDVAELSTAPLIASHSNAHAICASSRNLTDEQIRAIGQSGGIIGLNFANGFLRPDGSWRNDTDLGLMVRHLDHMIALAGEDHVGLGSDFEGARIPSGIGDVTGLPALTAVMAARGFGTELTRKICSDNWISVLERTWTA